MSSSCPLCFNQKSNKINIGDKFYWQCHICFLIFLDPSFYLNADQEKKHYMAHNNDVEDKGFQLFVSPIVDYVKENFNSFHQGLDFGAGTGPVISYMLKKMNYSITLYDLFFYNDLHFKNDKYDYIICCEVIEHFHLPSKEFSLMKEILKSSGQLIFKTDIYDQSIDFKNWYYIKDPTHVVFYQKETIQWMKENFQFTDIHQIDKRTFSLIK